MKLFSKTCCWCAVQELGERAVGPENDEVIVLNEDHVRDGMEGDFPFLDRAFHFFFGLFPISNILDDDGHTRFSVIEGGGDMLDSEVECLVVLVELFFDALFYAFECFFCVVGKLRELEEGDCEGLNRSADDLRALDFDKF